MQNLVIDIGNTRIKYGVFSAKELITTHVSQQLEEQEIFRLATNHSVENIIFSSVAATLPKKLMQQLGRQFQVLELNTTTPLPIKNAYQTPATLGKDRLAAVVGAAEQFPGKPCLVVDAGTCMTLDVIDAQKVYLGGNIAPGVQMRLHAMHAFTARLPLVKAAPTAELWGQSTQTALQNGGLLGAVLEMEGLAQRLQHRWPDLVIVLTGGDAEALAKQSEYQIFVHSNLVLWGLHKILSYNVQ